MKNLIYIAAIFFSINTFAQNPQLFDENWYLRDISIENNSNIPPTGCLLEFYNSGGVYNIVLAVCKDFYSNIITFDSSASFTILDESWFSGAGNCTNATLDAYRLFYYSFYEGNQATPFTYEILPDGDDLSLIITAQNGDQAIYGNTLLGTNDVTSITLSLYPNPTTTTLMLNELDDRLLNSNYGILDITGKQVKRATINTSTSFAINVEDLNAGVYFLKIKTKEGEFLTKRFVKK